MGSRLLTLLVLLSSKINAEVLSLVRVLFQREQYAQASRWVPLKVFN